MSLIISYFRHEVYILPYDKIMLEYFFDKQNSHYQNFDILPFLLSAKIHSSYHP